MFKASRRSRQRIIRGIPAQRARLWVESLEARCVPTAAITVTNLTDSGTGSLRAAIDAANAASGSDTIVFDIPGGGIINVTSFDTNHPYEFGPTAFVITDVLTITGPTATSIAINGGDALRLFAVASGTSLSINNLTLQHGSAQGGAGGNGGPGGGGAGLGGAIFNAGSMTIQNSFLADNAAIGGAGGDSVAVPNVGGGGGGSAGFAGGSTGNQKGGAGGAGVAGPGSTGGSAVGGIGGLDTNGGQALAGAAGLVGGGGGGANTVGNGGPGTDGTAIGGFGGGGGGGSAGLTGAGGAGAAGGFAAGGGGGGGAGGSGNHLGGNGGAGGFGGGGGAGNDGSGTGATGGSGGARGAFAGDGSNGTFAGIGGGGGGAGLGGTVFNNSGATLTVINSTFAANTAQGGNGGAPAGTSIGGNGGSGMGAAIFNRAGTVSIYNSTLADSTVTAGTAPSGGTAGLAEGAIYNYSDASGDATLTLTSTIVADTTGGSNVYNDESTGAATVDATASNLVEGGINGTGTINSTGLLTSDPQLAALTDNGGPTLTYALPLTSPAFDAGANPLTLTVDQRGLPRLSGSGVDIGAFELRAESTISGTVFLDLNANGTLDIGEPGLAQRTAFLDLDNNGRLDAGEPTADTDSSGAFQFSNVDPGSYTMRLVTYAGDNLTGANGGSVPLTVPSGADLTNQNLAIQPGSSVLPVSPNAAPYGASNPDLNTAFLNGLYHLVLGRDADAAGLDYWRDQLQEGTLTFGEVAVKFYHSQEYCSNVVQSFYRSFLGRQGEEPGVSSKISLLEAGSSKEQVALGFLDSPEYAAIHASNNDFVQSLYRNLLGREGEGPGVAGWVSQLNGGASRASVIQAFLHSDEEDRRAFDSFYVAFLGRQAETAGIDFWFARMQSGACQQSDVAAAFLASAEFISRAQSTV